jgi:2,3-diketo-5-methylthio-1-phosphopentane phosphatase
MRIYCDFDGTISKRDVTDHMLGKFADPVWEAVEADWQAGRITGAECMRKQIALLRASDAELDAELDRQDLDPGFVEFAEWCASQDLPLTVVSDGVDRFIRRILSRHALGHLPVISNQLAGTESRRSLQQPWLRQGCAAGSGVCKCEVVTATGADAPLVFVGDGRSDFCVSARADILFAKDALAAYAGARGQPHHVFADFDDVRRRLISILDERAGVAV